MEYANKEIQNLEKLFLVNLELEKELLQDGWKFFFGTLLDLLERELKGDLKTKLDINIMGSFINTLTRAGYDLSHNSEKIVLKKTWKAKLGFKDKEDIWIGKVSQPEISKDKIKELLNLSQDVRVKEKNSLEKV